jgi:hypothetical protein
MSKSHLTLSSVKIALLCSIFLITVTENASIVFLAVVLLSYDLLLDDIQKSESLQKTSFSVAAVMQSCRWNMLCVLGNLTSLGLMIYLAASNQSYICSAASIVSPSSSPPAAFSDLQNLQQQNQNVTDAALCHVPLRVVLSAALDAEKFPSIFPATSTFLHRLHMDMEYHHQLI